MNIKQFIVGILFVTPAIIKAQGGSHELIYRMSLGDINYSDFISADTFFFPTKKISRINYYYKEDRYIIEEYYNNRVKYRAFAKKLNDSLVFDGKFYEIYSEDYYIGFYKEGKLEGLYEGYLYPQKLTIKITYKNGVRNGRTINYHENGKVSVIDEYKNDMPDGIHIMFDSTSNLIEKGCYLPALYKDSTEMYIGQERVSSGGIPVIKWHKKGKWKYYENGKLVRVEIYRHRKLIRTKRM